MGAIQRYEFCHERAEAIQLSGISRTITRKCRDKFIKFNVKLFGGSVLHLKLGHRCQRVFSASAAVLAQSREQRNFLILGMLDTLYSKVRTGRIYHTEHLGKRLAIVGAQKLGSAFERAQLCFYPLVAVHQQSKRISKVRDVRLVYRQ